VERSRRSGAASLSAPQPPSALLHLVVGGYPGRMRRTEDLCTDGLPSEAGPTQCAATMLSRSCIILATQRSVMTQPARHSAPWFFWPLAALWDLLAFVLRLTGRLIGAIIGLVLMIVGIVITLTVVGAPLGVPLFILGLLLLMRSLF